MTPNNRKIPDFVSKLQASLVNDLSQAEVKTLFSDFLNFTSELADQSNVSYLLPLFLMKYLPLIDINSVQKFMRQYFDYNAFFLFSDEEQAKQFFLLPYSILRNVNFNRLLIKTPAGGMLNILRKCINDVENAEELIHNQILENHLSLEFLKILPLSSDKFILDNFETIKAQNQFDFIYKIFEILSPDAAVQLFFSDQLTDYQLSDYLPSLYKSIYPQFIYPILADMPKNYFQKIASKVNVAKLPFLLANKAIIDFPDLFKKAIKRILNHNTKYTSLIYFLHDAGYSYIVPDQITRELKPRHIANYIQNCISHNGKQLLLVINPEILRSVYVQQQLASNMEVDMPDKLSYIYTKYKHENTCELVAQILGVDIDTLMISRIVQKDISKLADYIFEHRDQATSILLFLRFYGSINSIELETLIRRYR